MVEASISLKRVHRRYNKRIFAVSEDINNAYIVLRDEDGIPLDLSTKIPRIKIYDEHKLIMDKELEIIDDINGICRLIIDGLEEGVYIARIELESQDIEEFLVVVQE